MARIFPSKIGRVASKGVAAAFRQFKKLPDDFQVWLSLRAEDGASAPLPHCFLLWQEKFGFLVHIADTSQPLAETALQDTLFQTEETITIADLGRAESEVLESFSAGLHRELGTGFPLCKLVIFPDVERSIIEAISLQRADTGVRFLGVRKLDAGSLAAFLEKIAEDALPAPCLLQLRRKFNPEAAVPASFSPLAIQGRNSAATLAGGLLDIDQEWCMKHDLHLPEEAAKLALEEGAEARKSNQLVTGVAGSGKSLVLLYRSLLNARLNPGARILLLTHNRPLNFELQRRADVLDGIPGNLACLTFFQWARQQLVEAGGWDFTREVIYPSDTEAVLAQLSHDEHARNGTAEPFTATFLADEIAWMKDNNIRDPHHYFTIERAGRGTALQQSAREEVWHYYKLYQQHLERHAQIDWGGIAMRFHEAALDGRLPFPRYDCILIDEAQFFAKAWFDIVNAALNPGGQLFLAADPTQGFLRRRQSWLSSGIEVRGRTTRLHQAYRNSRSILRFAAAFYKSRSPGDGAEDGEELNIPTADQIAAIPFEGSPPEVVHCPSEQDTSARLANELASLRSEGLPAGQVLIVTADTRWLSKDIAAALGGSNLVHAAKSGPRPPQAFCQICTLNAATGLEAPIVFLIGIESSLESEASPALAEDERRDLQRDHTRQLYMAFTRAGQRLVIFTHNLSIAEELEAIAHG